MAEIKTNKDVPVGVVVGRFQVPFLHPGHTQLLDKLRDFEKRCVILGVSRIQGDIIDPLDFGTRKYMIEEYMRDLSGFSTTILGIKDTGKGKEADIEWSKQVDLALEVAFPGAPAKIFTSRKGIKDYYYGKHEVVYVEPLKHEHNGTDIRNDYALSPEVTEDFRHGVIYGVYNQYPKVVPVVDICVYRWINKELHILLGRKKNQSGWRLPGGYVDTTDQSLVMAAARELREETCLIVGINDLVYFDSFRIDDSRYSRGRDVMMTSVFVTPYTFGMTIAGDDLVEVNWIKVPITENYQLANNHDFLISQLLQSNWDETFPYYGDIDSRNA